MKVKGIYMESFDEYRFLDPLDYPEWQSPSVRHLCVNLKKKKQTCFVL